MNPQQPNDKGVIPMALEPIEGMKLEPMQRPVFEQSDNGQEKLHKLVTDPEFLGRAAKGSMEKRQAVIDRQQPNDSELHKKSRKIEKRLALASLIGWIFILGYSVGAAQQPGVVRDLLLTMFACLTLLLSVFLAGWSRRDELN